MEFSSTPPIPSLPSKFMVAPAPKTARGLRSFAFQEFSESPKSGRAKGANGMVGARPARRDPRKSDGGMKEKERERSD